jgi:hypothetical protein
MLINFVSWNEIEKLKKKTFFSRKEVFFFEMRDAKWKCLLEWDKMLEKRFWLLFTCDYFKSKVFFYQRNVFLYSRSVFMYSKKCFSILILLLLLIHTRCDIVLRRFMQKMLYILQKEIFSKERKIFSFRFNRHLDFWTIHVVYKSNERRLCFIYALSRSISKSENRLHNKSNEREMSSFNRNTF